MTTQAGRSAADNPVLRVVVYRDDMVIFEGIPRPNDPEDFLVLAAEQGRPTRLDCSVPDLSASQQKASEQRFGPHRVIGECSGDPSCAVCHHAWPCPTAKQARASTDD